jgi:hypothetical protein
MTLDSSMIPQADAIWHVARVPEAVVRGAKTPAAIGVYLGDKVPRQGFYYARAARVLGLVEEASGAGEVALTAYGRAFAHYDRTSQRRALRRLLLEREPTRSVVQALIASGGLEREGVAQTLQRIATLSESTAWRRAQTVATWLRDMGLAEWRGGRLWYTGPRPIAGGMRAAS